LLMSCERKDSKDVLLQDKMILNYKFYPGPPSKKGDRKKGNGPNPNKSAASKPSMDQFSLIKLDCQKQETFSSVNEWKVFFFVLLYAMAATQINMCQLQQKVKNLCDNGLSLFRPKTVANWQVHNNHNLEVDEMEHKKDILLQSGNTDTNTCEEFPWAACLTVSGDDGVLISDQSVLTAAHSSHDHQRALLDYVQTGQECKFATNHIETGLDAVATETQSKSQLHEKQVDEYPRDVHKILYLTSSLILVFVLYIQKHGTSMRQRLQQMLLVYLLQKRNSGSRAVCSMSLDDIAKCRLSTDGSVMYHFGGGMPRGGISNDVVYGGPSQKVWDTTSGDKVGKSKDVEVREGPNNQMYANGEKNNNDDDKSCIEATFFL